MTDSPERALIDLHAATLAELRALVADATPAQWALPTGCPGWSVADNVSHVIGLELHFDGSPDPGAEDAPTEASVRLRRGRSKEQLLEEYDVVVARRTAALHAEIRHPAFDAEAAIDTPFGTARTFVAFMRRRIFDVYAHSQDVRRALGLPAVAGPAGELSVQNILRALLFSPSGCPPSPVRCWRSSWTAGPGCWISRLPSRPCGWGTRARHRWCCR